MADRARLGIRISRDFKRLIERYVESDPAYASISDFARAAFREKIRKDAPWLYEETARVHVP